MSFLLAMWVCTAVSMVHIPFESEPVYYHITYDGPCPYSAEVVSSEFLFDYDNLTLSPIDTQLLARALWGDSLCAKWITGNSASQERDTTRIDIRPDPRLIASYSFDGNADFLLLRYHWRSLVSHIAHLGYSRSSGEWHLISSRGIDARTVQANYNEMIDKQPGILSGVSSECRAAMIVSIVYGGRHPVFVIESYDDILISHAFKWKIGRGFDYPLNHEHLYFFNPSKNDVLMHFLKRDEILEALGELRFDLPTSSLDSAGIIEPLLVEHSPDSTSVIMSIYQWEIGEVARWRITFSEEGNLLSIDYVQPPYYRYQHGYNSGSPFKWWNRESPGN